MKTNKRRCDWITSWGKPTQKGVELLNNHKMNEQTYPEMKGMLDRDCPILGCTSDGEVIVPDLIKWFWCKEHLTSAVGALEQIKNKGTCQGIDSNILDNLSKIGLIK